MNINRNNYEEFFLLYVDGELSAEDRFALEDFVADNPDLAAELEYLKETVIIPDEKIVFENKSSLYKTGSASINEINCFEFFLLYADNELSKHQKQDVEKFIEQHPRFRNEFNLILQTVLQPELIEFSNKESLYRKEIKEPAPVAGIYLRRFGVAASLLVLIAAAWLLVSKPSETTDTLAQNQDSSVQNKISDTNTNPGNIVSIDSAASDKKNTVLAEQNNSDDLHKDSKKAVPISDNNTPAKNISDKKQFAKQPHNNDKGEPLIIAANTNIHNDATGVVPVNDTHNGQIAISENNVNGGNTAVTNISSSRLPGENSSIAGNNTNTVTVAALKELDTENDINDRSLYVGAFNLNKDKVKGIFRKAKNLFTEKAREQADEDGKLQVAGFSINTNNK